MPEYFVGLDLGQTSDPTAVAVLERGGIPPAYDYAVRHLKRYQLGTAYTAIIPDVVALCNMPPLAGNCALVADQTGVGRPIVEMLQASTSVLVKPVTITAGHTARQMEDLSYHVPKKDLVAVLQVLLQGRRLKVAGGLPLAELLVKELTNFKVKITAAMNETFGAWREGSHDDLVLAVALACWLAEREPAWSGETFGLPKNDKSIAERAAEEGVFES